MLEQAKNQHHLEDSKEQANEYYENNKDCKNNLEVNTENCETKKKKQKGGMEEIDMEMCLKKVSKN